VGTEEDLGDSEIAVERRKRTVCLRLRGGEEKVSGKVKNAEWTIVGTRNVHSIRKSTG